MRPHLRHLKRIGSLLRNGKTVWVRKPREPWGSAEGGRRARDMPCIDLLPIFCLFICFLIVVFTSRFLSETFHQATGDTFGEKISERNTVWKSLSDEEKAVRWFFPLIFKQIHCDLHNLVGGVQNYSKRAAETSFGIRAERAAQHERKIQKDAKKKIEAQEKKKMEKAVKQKELAKLKKSVALQAKDKAEASKQKLKANGDSKKGKKTVKKTTT